MAKQGGALPHKRVWRVSASAPQGQYIDSGFHDSKPPVTLEPPPETSWLQSSLDLAQGLVVIDRSDLPSELFGKWFGR